MESRPWIRRERTQLASWGFFALCSPLDDRGYLEKRGLVKSSYETKRTGGFTNEHENE